MTVKSYLLSLPERVVRSTLGLGAGTARELAEVALPKAVRNSQLYRNLVDTTLRYLIEQVGGVEGVYQGGEILPDNFLVRRGAGNAIELLGIVAFRASPVWVLAAMADVSGLGRHLIPEIADALKAQGLLEKEAQFTTVDQMLDGLERTSTRLAATINTPPLDVAGLRKEWQAIREEARALQPASLPSREALTSVWTGLKTEASRQNRSIFEMSSMMAVSAVRSTGQIFGRALLDHYGQTLKEIRQVGYATYAGRQLRPYVAAALGQFAPAKPTLTQRLLGRVAAPKKDR
jgi:hypothetical protein